MKLCIDPGHGMSNRRQGVYDSGATSGVFTEADIVLQIALSGKWIGKTEFGLNIFMTRDDDSDSNPVSLRDDKAELADCTHFISLHCNAASGNATGTETFYRDSRDKVLARIVQDSALSAWNLKDRGLKTESDSQHSRLAVFDFDGPCCLLETGFIDRKSDRDKLLSRDNRITFWRKLFNSLKDQN